MIWEKWYNLKLPMASIAVIINIIICDLWMLYILIPAGIGLILSLVKLEEFEK